MTLSSTIKIFFGRAVASLIASAAEWRTGPGTKPGFGVAVWGRKLIDQYNCYYAYSSFGVGSQLGFVQHKYGRQMPIHPTSHTQGPSLDSSFYSADGQRAQKVQQLFTLVASRYDLI